ncbi:tetratricopeptide repeat-containing sulfotransferase family protein, partial [Paraglaciecola sp.]|uniref:tetratricopeptide repeat-containing sulfotransferase family protein n=1 Tax=Paraglaciecola sp. TaxID=1920173 RepID=UPI003EF95006
VAQYDQSVSLLTKACHLLPNEPTALRLLSEAFNEVHSEIDALTVLEYGVKTFPLSANMFYQLALQQIMLGKFEAAISSLNKVIGMGDGEILSFTYHELSRLDYIFPKSDIDWLNARFNCDSSQLKEKSVIQYTLGNFYESKGEYKQAWRAFTQANRLQLQQCNFKTNELTPFFELIKNTFSKNITNETELDTNNLITPIFIVGLPRTGSTLLEQILVKHPNVGSAGEVNYLSAQVSDYLFQETSTHYPESAMMLTEQIKTKAAEIYLNLLSRHTQNKQFVIDKLPANFQSIGLIKSLFPQSKILHIQRDFTQVQLSVYKNNFAVNEPYFCDLEEFRTYHALYKDLMEHWHIMSSNTIFDVDYLDLVTKPEKTIREILDFCGATWSDRCLESNKSNNPVKTLSNIQVRQPMSPSQSWKPYLDYL